MAVFLVFMGWHGRIWVNKVLDLVLAVSLAGFLSHLVVRHFFVFFKHLAVPASVYSEVGGLLSQITMIRVCYIFSYRNFFSMALFSPWHVWVRPEMAAAYDSVLISLNCIKTLISSRCRIPVFLIYFSRAASLLGSNCARSAVGFKWTIMLWFLRNFSCFNDLTRISITEHNPIRPFLWVLWNLGLTWICMSHISSIDESISIQWTDLLWS